MTVFFVAFLLAQAPQQCGPLTGVLTTLRDAYGEMPIFTGHVASQRFVLTHAMDGNWSILRINDEDVACIVAAGSKSEIDKGV